MLSVHEARWSSSPTALELPEKRAHAQQHTRAITLPFAAPSSLAPAPHRPMTHLPPRPRPPAAHARASSQPPVQPPARAASAQQSRSLCWMRARNPQQKLHPETLHPHASETSVAARRRRARTVPDGARIGRDLFVVVFVCARPGAAWRPRGWRVDAACQSVTVQATPPGLTTHKRGKSTIRGRGLRASTRSRARARCYASRGWTVRLARMEYAGMRRRAFTLSVPRAVRLRRRVPACGSLGRSCTASREHAPRATRARPPLPA